LFLLRRLIGSWHEKRIRDFFLAVSPVIADHIGDLFNREKSSVPFLGTCGNPFFESAQNFCVFLYLSNDLRVPASKLY